MPDKDININVRAKNTELTKQQFDELAKSTHTFGNTVEQAGQQASQGTEKATKKFDGLKGIMTSVTTAVGGFLAAWKAADWLLNFLDKLAEKYERIRNLQKEIHEQARTLQESGQALENQTGTVGQQAQWAEYLTKVRTAGGLKSTGDAETASISFDIATGKTGGLANQANKDLLMQLAPMFATMQMSGEDVKKFLDFASTAGVEQSEQGYKEFFSRIYAGYRSSKSSNFGQFITGLQSGTTGIIAQGGSANGAISLYASALSVMKNEDVASTLAQQIGTLSSGAYEKPRQALEKFSGKSWDQLTPDEQIEVLLAYTQNIPANQRVQQLTGQGFSPELATGLSKMTSAEATRVLKSTEQAVGGADVNLLNQKIEAYKQSLPGKSNIRGGREESETLKLEKEIGAFQERLADAQSRVKSLAAQGKDNIWMDDEYEAYHMAYQQMIDELDSMGRLLLKTGTPEADEMFGEVAKLRIDLTESSGRLLPLPGGSEVPLIGESIEKRMKHRAEKAMRRGVEYETQLEELEQKAPTIINNYYNNKTIMTKEAPATSRSGDL